MDQEINETKKDISLVDSSSEKVNLDEQLSINESSNHKNQIEESQYDNIEYIKRQFSNQMFLAYKFDFNLQCERQINYVCVSSITSLQMSLENYLNEFLDFNKVLDGFINLSVLNIFIKYKNNYSSELIQMLCQSFGYLSNLKIFLLCIESSNYIGHDGFKGIGEGLKQLHQLENLILEIQEENDFENEVDSLSEGIKSLTNLKYLKFILFDNNIGPQGAIQLGDGLRGLTSLETLIFIFKENNIQYSGAIGLGVGIGSLVNLKKLEFELKDFRKIKNVGSQGVEGLSKAIYHLQNLEYLSFEIKILKFDTKSACSFGKSIGNLQKLKVLKFLISYGSGIGEEGAIGLGQGFKMLKNLETVECQVYHQNHLFETGAQQLVGGFKNSQNLKNFKLNLNDYDIKEQSAINLSEELKHLKYLNDFSLQLETSINGLGAESIFSSFKFMQNLSVLNIHIGAQDKIQEKGAIAIGESLKQIGNTLTKLTINLNQNMIGDQGLAQIAQSFKQLQKLNYLSFSIVENIEENYGFQGFVQCLSNLVNLDYLKLVLIDVGICNQGSKQLIDSLKYLNKLKKLKIELINNNINSNDIINIGKAIENLSNLTNLNIKLEKNKLCNESFQQFGLSLTKLKSLCKLSIFITNKAIEINIDLIDFFNYLNQINHLNYFSLCIVLNPNVPRLTAKKHLWRKIKHLVQFKQNFAF